MSHPAALDDEDLLADCEVSFGRTRGPGGQHRNKVETQATLTHRPSGHRGQAGERRSQADNRKVALFRLRLELARHLRAAPEPASELWLKRSRGGRIACNPSHRDFPALLAEALDRIVAAADEPRAAAEALGVSSSQLIKLVKQHPPSFADWNARRNSAGLRPLK